MNALNLGFGKPEFKEGNPVVQAMRRSHKQSSHRAHLRHGRDNETFGESVYRDLAVVGKFVGRVAHKALEALSQHAAPRESAARPIGGLALEQPELIRQERAA